MSVDPLFRSYPFYTPYQFSGNSPILNVDLDGLEELNNNELNKGKTNGENVIKKQDSKTIDQIKQPGTNKPNSTLPANNKNVNKVVKDVVEFIKIKQDKSLTPTDKIEQYKKIEWKLLKIELPPPLKTDTLPEPELKLKEKPKVENIEPPIVNKEHKTDESKTKV